jgi:triphosphatase
MSQSSRLTLQFDLSPEQAQRLRRSAFLRRSTVGRSQTRASAVGKGFRSHRHLRPDPMTLIEAVLSVAPTEVGTLEARLVGRLGLRLLEGSDQAFVDFVRGLSGGVALRLSAAQDTAQVQPINSADIDPGQATDMVVSLILRGCQTQLLALLPALGSGESEAVHQTRVALRRLRAALGLFKPLLPIGLVDHLNNEARWLGSILAPVRDWDVFISETLSGFRERLVDAGGIAELERRARAARVAAAVDMMEAVQSARCLEFCLAMELAIERQGWREQSVAAASHDLSRPLRQTAPVLLDRLWRAARREAKALQSGDPEAVHELRKKLKKLRYSVDFLQSIGPKRSVREFLGELSAMQQVLGTINDSAVADGLIPQLLARCPTPDLLHASGYIAGWAAKSREAMPPDLVKRWKRLRAIDKFWREPVAMA